MMSSIAEARDAYLVVAKRWHEARASHRSLKQVFDTAFEEGSKSAWELVLNVGDKKYRKKLRDAMYAAWDAANKALDAVEAIEPDLDAAWDCYMQENNIELRKMDERRSKPKEGGV